MSNLKIKIDIDADSFTWKDIKAVESGSPTKVYEVMMRFGSIEGVADDELGNHLDNLSIREMQEVGAALIAAIKNMNNPTDETGKNLNGGSPITSSQKRVSRR